MTKWYTAPLGIDRDIGFYGTFGVTCDRCGMWTAYADDWEEAQAQKIKAGMIVTEEGDICKECQEADMEDKINKILEILKDIPEERGKEFKVKCVCGGELKARRTLYDGHLHAKCDTCGFTFHE